MGNERYHLRRRDSKGSNTSHRQAVARDPQSTASNVLPMLDWPKDLFSRPEASLRETPD